MSRRRSIKVLSVLAGASLVIAACSDDDDDDAADEGTETVAEGTEPTATEPAGTEPAGTEAEGTEPEGTESEGDAPAGGTFSYGYEQEFFAYNVNTSSTNAASNSIIINRVLPDTFIYNGGDGLPIMDEELLDSAEVTSEDPLVIEFVINADAVWSDGDPIDCDDFYLHWINSNGVLKALDDAGNPAVDEATGAELLLFDTAGTTGHEQIESLDCSEDGKTVTLNFATPYPDWQVLFTNIVPAHIVEQQAGIEDIQAAYEAAVGGDRTDIEAAAEFYNTGWSLNPGELKPDIMPSGDALMISAWEAGSSLTLTKNPEYWGESALSDEIIVRYIEQASQAQALENREILAMDPQPNPELLGQLSNMADIELFTGNQFLYEHYDFNFAVEAFANPDVRKAFALCLPRQQIVDNLIKPQNPEAEVLNNRYFQPFEEGYTDTSGGEYDEVNIEEATALLEGAGVPLPLDVRLGYRTPNQRRTDQVALVKASCDQAGFNIIDSGVDTFFEIEWPEGNFDVAMFGWIGSALKTGSSSTYTTGGGSNNQGYSNTEVDELTAQLNQTIDPDAVNELATQIDTILWTDLATIPVFSHPAIEAHASTSQNVVYNPTQAGLTWNSQRWSAA